MAVGSPATKRAPTHLNAKKQPRASGGSEPEKPPQARLQALLELSLGDKLVVQAALAHALALAGRTELPQGGPELLAFVRAHLVNILTSELGPRLTIALLDDLAEELDPGSVDLSNELPGSSEPAPSTTPPFSGPRDIPDSSVRAVSSRSVSSSPRLRGTHIGLLLVDPDRVGRTSLARALVRAGANVTVADSIGDLESALESGENFDVALVDAYHPTGPAIVSALVRKMPHVVVVARSREATSTREMLTRLGVTRFDVRSHDAPAEELVDAMNRTLNAP